jgi:hypothetical protein
MNNKQENSKQSSSSNKQYEDEYKRPHPGTLDPQADKKASSEKTNSGKNSDVAPGDQKPSNDKMTTATTTI